MARQGFRIASVLLLFILFHAIPAAPGTDGEIVPQEPKGTRETIVVNASGGGDYTHIQWAIDNASEGDTVYVEAGIYNETVEIDKSISLSGESRDRTMITGEGRIVNVSADGVSVSGFTVTGSTVPYEGIGIYLENVSNCTISGNNCSNNSYCGIALFNTTHTTVMNNVCNFEGTEYGSLDATRGIGISSLYSLDNVIDANTCNNNTWCGIMLNNSDNTAISNNVCNSNGGRSTGPKGCPPNRRDDFGTGIYLIHSNNNPIYDNYCNNSFRIGSMGGDCSGVSLIDSHDNIVVDNMLYYAADFGVLLSGSERCRVQDNYCIGGWLGAICISGGKYNVIFRNHLPQYGITIISSYNIITHNLCENHVIDIMFSSSNNSIIGNTIRNSYYGAIYLGEDWGEWFDVNFSRIHHNNFINNSHYFVQAEDWGKHNCWNDSFGEGNYWSDYLYYYPNTTNDGIVWNQPYEVYGDNDAKDYFPLVNPIEEGEYYPAAMIGPLSEVDQHETFHFSGSNSFDYLGITNYTWEIDDNGKQIRLFGISPEYTFHDAGTYSVKLTVTNTQGNRDAATSTITVMDIEPPIANAGPDATIVQHQTYQFGAGLSSDNVGITSYLWSFRYENTIVNLSGPNPTFTFDIPGSYAITLRVFDARGNWGEDVSYLSVWDSTKPTAKAGYDIFIDQHETVVFNGSRSIDNVGIVNYTWRFNDGDTHLTRYGETCGYTFDDAGKYAVTLNVSDDEGNWDTDDLIVNVRDITPPVADAGSNISVFQDSFVTFNGSNSTDNIGIVNYTWSFNYSHRKRNLYGPTPDFFFDRPGLYKITLKVWDPLYFSDRDHVWVEVIDNEKPFVDAGKNTTIYGECTLRFDGSNSRDNVGIENYTWIIEHGGKIIKLYGLYPEFPFLDYGRYTITLQVRDAEGNVGEDTFNITVMEILETNGKDDNDNDVGDPDPDMDRNTIIDEYDLEIIIWMGTLVVIFIVAIIGLLLYFFRKKDQEPIEQSSEDEMGRVGNDGGDEKDG